MCATVTHPTFDLMVERGFAFNDIIDILVKPVAWTRLEPQTRSGNPDAWLATKIHDAAWMLGRQWQAGEFLGEDCGTPLSVEVTVRHHALAGFRPGRLDQALKRTTLSPGAVIEPEVEREPWAMPGLADRATAGLALASALAASGANAALPGFSDADLTAAEKAGADPGWLLAARRSPDGEACALALEAGPPGWLSGAPAEANDAAKRWLEWYRRNVSDNVSLTTSWQNPRFEYSFALDTGTGAKARVLQAPLHDGGLIDWHTFELEPANPAAATAGEVQTARVHAGRLRYAGMPADRLWEFEDGFVNFGTMDVQANDLIRQCFLEFATLCGNDWLVAPIDLPRGVLAAVTGVSYRTTFGETVTVQAASDIGRRGRFSMFTTNQTGAAVVTEPMFLIPPGGRSAQEGPSREDVVFARDEMANMAWAIEVMVEGPDGLARDRRREATVMTPVPQPMPGADLVYRLETDVPPWWVPMVPVPKPGLTGGFSLRKGSFSDSDGARGRLLQPTPFDVFDEEVPREGVRVRRVPSVMRDEFGVLQRWIARRVGPAGGEAASNLAYDNTFSAS
ncbi:hypothetical protein [Pseudotabrizicola sp. 4114]|uniref:hypothetical protein n=1 Tax=Pseudotabrizicola sp. 4114 TaxID=2817731 RepID=UPI0028610054|nr:hypothetical protein [Pseudorhodobacter sp. 4114]